MELVPAVKFTPSRVYPMLKVNGISVSEGFSKIASWMPVPSAISCPVSYVAVHSFFSSFPSGLNVSPVPSSVNRYA